MLPEDRDLIMKELVINRLAWLRQLLLVLPLFVTAGFIHAADGSGSYLVNPGDVLSIDVFNEATLSEEQVVVRPDGFISVPVVGEVKVGGGTISAAQKLITEQFGEFLRDEPNVVVHVLATQGSRVFVIGKVQRPGAFPLSGDLDVVQALALAGGLNQFAAENKIKVIRRGDDGVQKTYRFRYSDISDGEKLENNILLRSGDVILVP